MSLTRSHLWDLTQLNGKWRGSGGFSSVSRAPADAGSPQPAGPVVTRTGDAVRGHALGQAQGVFSGGAARSSKR